jgi:hypothetical protein
MTLGGTTRNVARSAQPALVADPHDDLAADDPEHLVPEMGVHLTAAVAGGGGAGARSPPSAAADRQNVQQRRENRHCRGTRKAHHSIDRVRGTSHLAYLLMRHAGLSVS